MTDRIRLRAASGIVIDFTLPLHESITHQWRNGELQRDEDDDPVRPADSAPKKAWQDYAVAVGALSGEEAAGMTRQQLIDASTPPELRPEGI